MDASGIAAFSQLSIAWNEPITVSMKMACTREGSTITRPFSLTIGDCSLGETNPSGRLCKECEADSFSWNPRDPKCIDCPENGVCPGAAFLSQRQIGGEMDLVT
jgi:hypothetical protein